MSVSTKAIIVIKWLGVVFGTLAYVAAAFFEIPYNFLIMPFAFLVWFTPFWLIGWIFKGYKSIIPYPYPMKKDLIDYYKESRDWLIFLLVGPFCLGIFYLFIKLFL